MPKFRKKQIVIEAVQLGFATCVGNKALPDWATRRCNPATFERWHPDGHPVEVNSSSSTELPAFLRVNTLEGVMIGREGDYLICGVENEVYPCKLSVFEATYEPLSE